MVVGVRYCGHRPFFGQGRKSKSRIYEWRIFTGDRTLILIPSSCKDDEAMIALFHNNTEEWMRDLLCKKHLPTTRFRVSHRDGGEIVYSLHVSFLVSPYHEEWADPVTRKTAAHEIAAALEVIPKKD